MEPEKEWVELGPGTRRYVGVHELVITADDAAAIREGLSRVFVTDDQGEPWEWRLRDVLPGAGYIQCSLLRPDDVKHGVTMFVFPGYVSLGADKFKPADLVDTRIEVVPFGEI